MERTRVCHRCGKDVGPNNAIVVKGKRYGISCAREITRLLKLRSDNPNLVYLCSEKTCTDCLQTFNCPIKSAVNSDSFPLLLD